MEGEGVTYRNGAPIRFSERDRTLGIDGLGWPEVMPDGWQRAGPALRRVIERDDAGKGKGKGQATPPKIPVALEELMLRFPSAPIHGLQRMHAHHVKLGPSKNFHTFRLLRSADPEIHDEKVARIFLMHTGLNERDTMGTYYRLASQLIAQEPTTVCIVRPFPGHLTRYPFQAFAETPLDNYLWDGSHLFRQFSRFMIETQWFLSAIVRRSSYRCASGANLLGESDEIESSRLEAPYLAAEMKEAWTGLWEASIATAKAERRDARSDSQDINDAVVEEAQFLDAIEALREVLNLGRDFPSRSGSLGDDEAAAEPKLHVIGYSLGGFTAQSVFMSWPFLISSCSSVLAGGALRDLAPTGFTDPEEWQTVLHSLRYELDDRMMSEHLGANKEAVAGIDRELFTYFKRTFYEVFLQEHSGSIKTRLEAFRERMLFIVGGNDPVVKPESVLKAGPKGGINLLEIGGLGHFLEGSTSDRAEQQQNFWLPEMVKLIHEFSNEVADEQDDLRPYTWFDSDLAQPKLSRQAWNAKFFQKGGKGDGEVTVRPLEPHEVIAIEGDGALPGELFERCLDDLLYRASSGDNGILFVLRNEVPTALQHPSAVREAAAALYHDDFSIVRYCHGVAARQKVVENAIDRLCLVLPWNARRITEDMDLQRGYPSQAESAGGRVANRLAPRSVWEHALKSCYELSRTKKGRESIRMFDGNASLDDVDPGSDLGRLLALVKRKGYAGNESITGVPSLPDSWVWVSRDRLVNPPTAKIDVQKAIRGLASFVQNIESPAAMQQEIRDDKVRIVNVSRARYNPRFRGRLLVDGRAALKRLLHVSLCLEQSEALASLPPESAFS
jgi:hypothetical protein